jgi:hypothetical protein
MAEITTTQTMGNKTITTTINTAARGPKGDPGTNGTNGSDAEVTQANIEAAITDKPGFLAEIEAVGTDGTGAEAVPFWEVLAPGADVQGAADLVNSQPYCFAKIAGWSNSSAPPINYAVVGDSLAVLGKPFLPSPNMAIRGYIGGGYGSATGGTPTAVTLDFTRFVTGSYIEYPVGCTAEFSCGEDSPRGLQGDRAAVYHIRGPGRGTYDIQYQVQPSGAWTNLQTGISTANATIDTQAIINNLGTSNSPYYKIRITNITGASVYVAGAGIYYSSGGGIIWNRLFAVGNINIQQMVTTPSAVFNPVWTSTAPDLVVACWADPAADWDSGGAFRTLYAATQSLKSATDWVMVSATPNESQDWTTQRTAQRAWALSANQSWINGFNLFRSWTVANGKGLMIDSTHLSNAGGQNLNRHLWATLPIGQASLGRALGGQGHVYESVAELGGAGQIDALTLEFGRQIKTGGTAAGLVLGNRAIPLNDTLAWTAYSTGGVFHLFHQGANRVSFGSLGGMTLTGSIIGTPNAMSGAGAVTIDTLTTKLTTTGAAQALTLANGADGQIKTIIHDVDGGSAVLTPATKTGYSTITFTNAGESATLQFVATRGWIILSLYGAVAA